MAIPRIEGIVRQSTHKKQDLCGPFASTKPGQTNDYGGAGGLETLTYVDPDCQDHIDVVVDVSLERSIVFDNFLVDPDLTDAYAPNACSPVFDVKRCAGSTTTCLDDLDCPVGPPQVPCVTGVGFHGKPDIVPDLIIDGLDVLSLAITFGTTDAPDPASPRPRTWTTTASSTARI